MDILFITIGCLMLLGLLAESLGRHTAMPRVTLLMLVGMLMGQSGFDLVPTAFQNLFPAFTHIALLMIGFLLGERLATELVGERSRLILILSLTVVLVTAVLVAGGMYLFGVPLAIALLFGGISTATAPAAVVDVVKERGIKSPEAGMILGIVAIDDAFGLILFSILLALADVVSGNGTSGLDLILHSLYELGGAMLLGAALSVPAAWATGRVRKGEPSLLEGLGVVFLCGGLALHFELSFLVAAMTLGAGVALRARHHRRPFHAIENVEDPFLILFFLLAGASLDVRALLALGSVGILYFLLRIVGRLAGGWLGGWLGGTTPAVRRWSGIALLPQAGVAVGMALVGAQRFPEMGAVLLPVVIGSTVLFELVGPVGTRAALTRME